MKIATQSLLRPALTVDVEADPLADGGRDVVAGDAEVGPHLRPAHPRQAQVLPLVLGEARPAAVATISILTMSETCNKVRLLLCRNRNNL